MSHRTRMDAQIRQIEAKAAERLWKCRDTLTVETLLSPHATGPWNRRFVRYDEYVYHPVVSISDDFSSATALVQTPDGAITLQAGSGPLAEAWEAALSWRALKLLSGTVPTIREWVPVPRTGPIRGRDTLWDRLLRSVSPYVRLHDEKDIVRHDLAMLVLTTILENDIRPIDHGTSYDVGNGIELRVQGRRVPRYTIVHPDDGGVPIPARLRRTFDETLSERALASARDTLAMLRSPVPAQ